MEAALGSSFLVGALGVAALAWGAYSYAAVSTGVGQIVELVKELRDHAKESAEATRERVELMRELLANTRDDRNAKTKPQRRDVVFPYNFTELESDN